MEIQRLIHEYLFPIEKIKKKEFHLNQRAFYNPLTKMNCYLEKQRINQWMFERYFYYDESTIPMLKYKGIYELRILLRKNNKRPKKRLPKKVLIQKLIQL